ncbi:MAG: amidohydrolase [Candidatus Eisenbacteria bacterium]|nr:amidohydrolase [Candidatus Eisenbacteria bacterium]
MVFFRRDLHAHPELGFKETRTAAKIAERLSESYGNVRTGIARTGVSALLEPPGASGRAILFRADMDALPVQEESASDYASRVPGVMHACGHDGHIAILLHAARLAARSPASIRGAVRFVFQPAEEGPGGAAPMIQEGILKDPPIEAAFGLHLWSGLPTGRVAVTSGPMMAAADEFDLIVHGRGGHGAYPHEAVDAVVVASQIVVALQTVVSRNADPIQTAVLSIGQFNAGQAFNVIAETAHLRGTIRAFRSDVREKLIRRLREVSEGVAAALGARCEFVFKEHYPPTVNDPRMADFAAALAAEVVGPENVVRDLVSMGGEDMSFFLREVPGAYLFLGAGNDAGGTAHPHHSPRFDFDEEAMPIGVEIFLRIMEGYWTAFPERPTGAPGAPAAL